MRWLVDGHEYDMVKLGSDYFPQYPLHLNFAASSRTLAAEMRKHCEKIQPFVCYHELHDNALGMLQEEA